MSDPAPDQKTKHEQRTHGRNRGNLRLFGVPIRLHFTFVLLLIFLPISIGLGGKQSGAATAVYILALFASVLLHEEDRTYRAGSTLVRYWHARDCDVSNRRGYRACREPAESSAGAVDRRRRPAGQPADRYHFARHAAQLRPA